MASVYANAYLTIAASNSDADNKGFLNLRPKQFTIPIHGRSGELDITVHLQLFLRHHGSSKGTDLMIDEPLTQRAWAVQERYLARRSLFYGTEQMVWDCQEITIAENGNKSSVSIFESVNYI